jgi:hypothetical protein
VANPSCRHISSPTFDLLTTLLPIRNIVAVWALFADAGNMSIAMTHRATMFQNGLREGKVAP